MLSWGAMPSKLRDYAKRSVKIQPANTSGFFFVLPDNLKKAGEQFRLK
jgi:hypothetical protein